MAKNQENAEQLGRAWALHIKGQNDDAIHEFNALLQTSANNMDALYGLGLAQRSSGKIQAAQDSFQKCASAINSALAEKPREDRYQMLQRMIKQRIDETKDK